MARDKMYVEYPIATSLEQAIAWLKDGNQCWQEDSNDWPSCGGFDEVGDLEYNFPDGIDKTYNIHLVPAIEEEAPPFKVGDEVVSLEELPYCCGQDGDDIIKEHSVCRIDRIGIDQNEQQQLFFNEHPDRYGPWKADNFVLNVCGDE